MTALLTTQARSDLTSVVLGNSSSIIVPKYIEIGYGPGAVSPSDESVFGPLQRISGTVGSYTTVTSGDTFKCSGTFVFNAAQPINNIGLFDVPTSAPVGTILRQVNFNDRQVVISGYNNFPNNSYPFEIQVLSEVMTVVSGNGTDTWNVIRAVNGSSLTLNPIPTMTQVVGGTGTTNGNMFLKASFLQLTLDAGSTIEFNIYLQFV